MQVTRNAMFLWSWTKPPTCACCILVSNTNQSMPAAAFPGSAAGYAEQGRFAENMQRAERG